jgi:DHA2 family multidrug resistance protein
MAGLQIMLDKGQDEDWFSSNLIRVLFVMAVVGLIGFIIRELRTSHPIVDLRIFKIRTYSTGVFMMTVLGFVLYGSTVLIPIWLQTLMGYPSLQAGFAMLPRGLGSFLMMPVVGLLMSKVEPRKLLAGGIVLAAVSLFQLAHLSLNAGYWDIFWPQILQGFAMGLLFVPLTTITNDPIPLERMGNATSLFNVMRNIGASVGISTVTTIVVRHSQVHTNILGAHVNPYNPAATSMLNAARAGFMAKGFDAVTATKMAYAGVFGMVQRQAAMLSFTEGFRLLGFVFLLMMPLILLMKRPQQKGGAVVAH